MQQVVPIHDEGIDIEVPRADIDADRKRCVNILKRQCGLMG